MEFCATYTSLRCFFQNRQVSSNNVAFKMRLGSRFSLSKNLKLCIFRIIIIIPKNHRQPPQKKSLHTLHPTHVIHIFTSCIYFYHHCGKKNVHLITSWWLNQPKLKNMIVKMGSSSPGIGVEIKKYLSCQPPRKISQFYIYHFYKLPIG